MPNFEKLQESHPKLAQIFAENWELPLEEYAPKLFESSPSGGSPFALEPLFLKAFEETLGENGYSYSEIDTAKEQLLKKPVLQTSHHLTPTHGPTFFTLDLQALSGLGPGEPLLIGANSGVAFSNTAWSGALSYQDVSLEELLEAESPLYRQTLKGQSERESHGEDQKRISLIPSKVRDQLVFGETIPQSLVDAYSQMTEDLQALLPPPKLDEAYSPWALQTARSIQKSIFGREFIIFDINQLVANYLGLILTEDASHPLCELLFDSEKVKSFNGSQDYPITFLGSYRGKKSSKVEIINWDGSSLKGPKRGQQSRSKETLAQELKTGRLCPGVALVFLVVHFSAKIKCLGSFNQVEYLQKMQSSLKNLALGFSLPEFTGEALTTGRLLKDGMGYMPLDLSLNKTKITLTDFQKITMGEFWDYYLQRLTDETP